MQHVAIMKKSWGLIPKILSGEKKIESRWSIYKCAPWGKVKRGDTIYFKNSGEPVVAKASVDKIEEYENLNPDKVKALLRKYGGKNGIAVNNLENTISWAKNKRYCTLIFLINPRSVKPFNIDKSGYGTPIAWLNVKSINKIKLPI